MNPEVKFYKDLYEKTRGIIDSQQAALVEQMNQSDLSSDAKLDIMTKKEELNAQLAEIAALEKAGPKEPVTLESLGIKSKNPEKDQLKLDKLIDRGILPEDAKEFFDASDDKSGGEGDDKDKKGGEGDEDKKDEKDPEKKDDQKADPKKVPFKKDGEDEDGGDDAKSKAMMMRGKVQW